MAMMKKSKAEIEAEEPKAVVTEMVISMAPAHFTREQVLDLIRRVEDAKAKGLTVRFT